MKLLAIDTSTEACSASLFAGNRIYTRCKHAPRMHAELVLPMVRELLDAIGLELDQLDALAFGQGPGAFTGVRIATGIVQGLAFATNLPVVPVSSLATLAQSAADRYEFIMPAFDARMGEVYYGFYRAGTGGLVEAVSAEGVADPEKINPPPDGEWFGIGTGWTSYADVLRSRFGERYKDSLGAAWPSTEFMIPLALAKLENGQTVAADKIAPVYLRNRVTG